MEGLLAQAQAGGWIFFIDRLARTPLSQILIFAVVCTGVRLLLFPYLKNTPIHKRGWGYRGARFFNELSDALVYASIVVFMLVRPFAIQTFVIPSPSMVETLRVSDFIVANKWVYRVSDPVRGDIIVFRPPRWALVNQQETDYIKRLVGLPGEVVEIRDKVLYVNGQVVEEPYVDYTDPFIEPRHNIVLPRERWDEVPMPDFKMVEREGQLIPLQYTEDAINGVPLHILADMSGFSTAPRYTVWEMMGYTPEQMQNDEGARDRVIAEAKRLRDLPAAAIPAGYHLFMGDNRNGSFDSRGWGLVPRDSLVGRSEFIWLPFGRIGATR